MPVTLTPDRTSHDPLVSRFAASTGVVNLALSNGTRSGLWIYNESGGAIMYVLMGGTSAVSATNYSVQIAPGGLYEMPLNPRGKAQHSGAVTAVWASASGACMVTEFGKS